MTLRGLALASLVLTGTMAWSSTGHATNKYVIHSINGDAQLKISLGTPSKTYNYTPSAGEVEWQTAYNSIVEPKAAVTLTCTDSGWRTYSLGPVAYGAQPSDWFRKATQVTAEVPAPYLDVQGLIKEAKETICPNAIAADIWTVPVADRNQVKTLSVTKNWNVQVKGQCIRTKIPFVGKIENLQATKSIPVEIRCTYAPSTALRDNDPLKLWWSGPRQDNFTSRSDAGDQAATAAKYQLVRTEARTLVWHAGGSHSLDLYWNPTTADNLSTTPLFKAPAGYSLVRKQGYVYASPQPYTVPLKLYYSAARKDYMTTATAQGEADCKAAGYQLVKVIGHAIPQK